MRASKCLMLAFFFKWSLKGTPFSFLFVPRTSFRGFFSLLRASLEKNDLGQFLHVSCLFWSSSFGIKNILLEAHTWSNKRFLMSERRI